MKQAIILRIDLGMGKGKLVAQGSHASLAAFLEAKKADISLGIPQCIAQMIGSRVLNEKRNHPIHRIYGCVTTAEDWQFLLLEQDHVIIDITRYYLNEIENILGILQKIVDEHFRRSIQPLDIQR